MVNIEIPDDYIVGTDVHLMSIGLIIIKNAVPLTNEELQYNQQPNPISNLTLKTTNCEKNCGTLTTARLDEINQIEKRVSGLFGLQTYSAGQK